MVGEEGKVFVHECSVQDVIFVEGSQLLLDCQSAGRQGMIANFGK